MVKILEMFHKPIAHRGLHGGAIIENSLGAFSAAIEQGLGIELDIHMMGDGTIVVHHDESLDRLCGIDKRLDNLNSEDLANYPLQGSGEKIPTLSEVLDLTAGKVPLLIELKISNSFNPVFTQRLLQLLDTYAHKQMIALQSFNPYAVAWLKTHTTDYPIGQLSSGKLSGQKWHVQFMFKTLLINKISHPDFVSFDIEYLPSPFVTKCRKRGMPIIAWTIDDEQKRAKALLYADQFIFEKIPL